jgi:adenylate kinase
MQPVLVLLGPPGAGKGTQGARISAHYNLPKISTGEIFRDLAAAGTQLGLLAKSYWSEGKLVPDDIVVGLVRERIDQDDCDHGFLLDGFPRTVAQAEILECLIEQLDMAFAGALYFDVEAEELIRRLSGRRGCTHCGATYHVSAMPPRTPDVCDYCSHGLTRRDDDTPESIRTRLEEYHAKTAALLTYYESRGLLYRIDAGLDPQAVSRAVETTLSVVLEPALAVSAA